MKKSLLALLALFVVSADAHALTWQKCAEKIRAVRSDYVVSYDLSRQYKSCKEFQAADALVLIAKNGDVVTIGTRSGSLRRFQLGSDVREDKIIAGKTFMVTYDGKLYFMDDDKDFYEVYNSSGRSYNLNGIKGKQGDASVVILEHRQSAPTELQARYVNRKVRKVYFYPSWSWYDFYRW